MMNKSEKNEIHDVLDAFVKAMHDRDAEAATALYAEDAQIYSLAPPLAERPDEAQLALWLNSWDGPVTYELRDVKIETGPGIAFAFGMIRVSADTQTGERAEWWMRATRCFKRIDGEWKIVNEHDSVPFYMDGSDRAATDLQPE